MKRRQNEGTLSARALARTAFAPHVSAQPDDAAYGHLFFFFYLHRFHLLQPCQVLLSSASTARGSMSSKHSSSCTSWHSVINHIVYERDLLDFDVCDGSRADFFKGSTQLKPPLCLPLLADGRWKHRRRAACFHDDRRELDAALLGLVR